MTPVATAQGSAANAGCASCRKLNLKKTGINLLTNWVRENIMQTTDPQTQQEKESKGFASRYRADRGAGLQMSGKEFYGKGGHGYEADLERPAARKLPLWANVR